jgi:hypothetical protein
MNKTIFCLACALGICAIGGHNYHVMELPAQPCALVSCARLGPMPLFAALPEQQYPAAPIADTVQVAPVRTYAVTVDMPMGLEFRAGIAD